MMESLTPRGWLVLFALVALAMIVFLLWADTVITPIPAEMEAGWLR